MSAANQTQGRSLAWRVVLFGLASIFLGACAYSVERKSGHEALVLRHTVTVYEVHDPGSLAAGQLTASPNMTWDEVREYRLNRDLLNVAAVQAHDSALRAAEHIRNGDLEKGLRDIEAGSRWFAQVLKTQVLAESLDSARFERKLQGLRRNSGSEIEAKAEGEGQPDSTRDPISPMVSQEARNSVAAITATLSGASSPEPIEWLLNRVGASLAGDRSSLVEALELIADVLEEEVSKCPDHAQSVEEETTPNRGSAAAPTAGGASGPGTEQKNDGTFFEGLDSTDEGKLTSCLSPARYSRAGQQFAVGFSASSERPIVVDPVARWEYYSVGCSYLKSSAAKLRKFRRLGPLFSGEARASSGDEPIIVPVGSGTVETFFIHAEVDEIGCFYVEGFASGVSGGIWSGYVSVSDPTVSI